MKIGADNFVNRAINWITYVPSSARGEGGGGMFRFVSAVKQETEEATISAVWQTAKLLEWQDRDR